MTRPTIVTIVGTRPEIIRLAATIKRLESDTEHVLVHTGQNYDYELNEVFFEDLGLRKPDHFLEADTSSLGAVLGSILQKVERGIEWLLMAYAKAENMDPKPDDRYTDLRSYWGQFTAANIREGLPL